MTSSPSAQALQQLLQGYANGERDFSGIELSECTLSGAKLPHIILRRANLKVVNLSNANLSHSDLQQAVLNVSRLSGANLSQANLQQAQLNVANLIQSVLIGANLSKASLIRAELLRADLSNAVLTGANLQEADLREARLRWATLSAANLSRSNLRSSNLVGANLSAAQLSSATLESANLKSAVLVGAELRHANLRAADLSGANLRGANLRWANLSGANFQDADLTDAKLSGADLMGARLTGAVLENTTLVHADLSRSNLQQARCVDSDLSGATLTGAQMFGAVFYDVQTQEMLCEWVDLSPQGGGTQTRHFTNAAERHAFFNHRPPQVKVVVDHPMSLNAHAAIATLYEKLGQANPLFKRPPNIETTHRRTVLTFIVEAETSLSAIAYLATWPFQDSPLIHTTFVNFISQGMARSHRSPAQDDSHQKLHQALQTLPKEELEPWRQSLLEQPFFHAPIQVRLSNASAKTLQLYQHPQFGIRNLPGTEDSTPSSSENAATPTLSNYLAFLSPDEP